MPRTKRASDADDSARASKIAKKDAARSPSAKAKKGTKRGPKTSLSGDKFTENAGKIHVSLTHMTPGVDDSATADAETHPGFIGGLTLLPSIFSTGSYGWKGSKRITVEMPNPKTGAKEKLQVMLNINASVLGSKQAPKNEGGDMETEDKLDPEDEEDANAEE